MTQECVMLPSRAGEVLRAWQPAGAVASLPLLLSRGRHCNQGGARDIATNPEAKKTRCNLPACLPASLAMHCHCCMKYHNVQTLYLCKPCVGRQGAGLDLRWRGTTARWDLYLMLFALCGNSTCSACHSSRLAGMALPPHLRPDR